MSHIHNPGTESCTVQFKSDKDMDKGLEVLLYDSPNPSFSGVDEKTINVTKEECELLQQAKDKKELDYTNIE